jgi:hypothetical protein
MDDYLKNSYEDDIFRVQLKSAEEKYKTLQRHVIDNDLEEDEIPLLDAHLTKLREEIVELKEILGIFNAE